MAPRRAERHARVLIAVVLIAVVLIVAACGPTRGSESPPAEPSATRSEVPSAAPATSPPASPNTPAADVRLETLFSDLATPIGLVVAPGVDHRTFIIEQTGRIHVVQGTERLPSPFLNLADRLVRLSRDYDERGLLGLAFHPEFATNGRMFVYYSTPASADAEPPVDHTNRLSEFTVGLDADAADPDSERVILEFDQPQPNHSGGALGFGPDGFLYLGTGDGGGRGDADPGHSPQGNAQDPDRLNGKILRIDVDSEPSDGGTYAIPADNPYAAGGGRPEIYASGFRNPWRLSWEPTGGRRLLVSDVGYGRYEEVDAVVAGGNYGWRIREGAHCLDIEDPLADTTGCPTEAADGNPLIDPVIEYTHAEVGIAVVGGYVYRGTALPALQGQYVFADYTPDWTTPDPDPHGTLLVATPVADTSATWPWRRLSVADDALNHFFVTGMGEDAAGELYVMARHQFGPIGQTGFVFRIVPPVYPDGHGHRERRSVSRRIAVAIETSPKKTFATAVDWPGWSRSAKTTELALEALAAYAPRYVAVAREAGETIPDKVVAADFDVIEEAEGGGGTDFRIPSRVTDADRRRTSPKEADRLRRLVAAAWRVFDRVAASAPAELRKGPRGGGRDRDKMIGHVVEADGAYAREIGLRLKPPDPANHATVKAMRDAVLDAIGAPSDGSPLADRKWTARYAASRIAWHALDHAWEMEDRSKPA